MRIPLPKLPERVKKLLDEAKEINPDAPRKALDKVVEAYNLISKSPGNWKTEPIWMQARDYYKENVKELKIVFLILVFVWRVCIIIHIKNKFIKIIQIHLLVQHLFL